MKPRQNRLLLHIMLLTLTKVLVLPNQATSQHCESHVITIPWCRLCKRLDLVLLISQYPGSAHGACLRTAR